MKLGYHLGEYDEYIPIDIVSINSINVDSQPRTTLFYAAGLE